MNNNTGVKTKLNVDLLKGLARTKSGKAVLLYSGGIDSTFAGILLKQQKYEVYPLFFDYGQSAFAAEKRLVTKTAKKLGFKEVKIIKTDLMKQLSKSKLLGRKSVDDNDAWVPGRNTLFMIIAGIYAKQVDADGVAIGYMLDDNFVFGDNDYFHHKAVEDVLAKSFLQPFKVLLPLMAWHKKDIVAELVKRNLLDSTVSCWNAKLSDGKITVCHKCANCIEREQFLSEGAGKL